MTMSNDPAGGEERKRASSKREDGREAERSDEELTQEVATAAEPWVERLARFGYFAKGVVYIAVGWLSMQAAIGVGGTTTDTEGALSAIFRQPLGPLLLAVVGVGLICYSAWRVGQGLFDFERKGRDLHGLVKRTGYLGSALAYGTLAFTAISQAIGLATTGGRSQEDWTALVLARPAGRYLVIAAGVVLAALAINAAVVALRGLFRRKLKLEEMSEAAEGWASTLAVSGLLARGLVFGLLAIFFVQAGWESDASEAGGLSQVLVAIASQPQGPWLLGATAAGLVAYGLFALVQARYRRISVPQSEE